MFVFDAIGCNEAVDCLANGDSLAPQRAIIAGALQRQCRIHHLYLGVFSKRTAGLLEIGILSKPLQHFSKNDVADQNRRLVRNLVKIIRLRTFNAIKVINPNRRVNDQHGYFAVKRDLRCSSRSPSHFNLPRKLRISPCSCKRMSVRKASFTTSRLVLIPVNFWARSTSLSSSTILVRMFVSSLCVQIQVFMCIILQNTPFPSPS